MIKLAVCIPTFQNSIFVEELLEAELRSFQKHDVDVYIMDSSNDDETKTIVERYTENTQNLFYYRFPSALSSNEKLYLIFQMVPKEISCDYLWVRSDAIRCDSLLFSGVLSYLHKGYDLYVLNTSTRFTSDFITMEENAQTLFDHYCYALVLYGAAILKVSSMIIPANWNYLSKRYLSPKYINFSHVCFYFEQILYLPKFASMILNVPGIMYRQTSKKRHPSWYKETLKIWLSIWPNAIEYLPTSYRNKSEVIKARTYERFFPFNLKKFAADGILDTNAYRRYKHQIRKYSDVPKELFFEAAHHINRISPYGDLYHRSKEYSALMRFAKRHHRLVIYGCGIVALRYEDFLRANQIDIEGFVVSSEREAQSKSPCNGHTVIPINKLNLSKKMGVVLGMRPAYQGEVFPILEQMGVLEDYVFSYPDSYSYISQVIAELQRVAFNEEGHSI